MKSFRIDRKVYPLRLTSQWMEIDALHVINLTLFELQCVCRLFIVRGSNEVMFYINHTKEKYWLKQGKMTLSLFFLIKYLCVIVWANSLFWCLVLVRSFFLFCYVFDFMTCGIPPVGPNQFNNRQSEISTIK